MSARETRRDELIIFLEANPTGVTVDEMAAELGCSLQLVNHAIRDVRLFLGDSDDFNLICNPRGYLGRWLYQLVGNLDGARPWVRNRLADADSRLLTMESVMLSIVNATSGRTRDGRKARVIERALRRMREDMEDLDLNGMTP